MPGPSAPIINTDLLHALLATETHLSAHTLADIAGLSDTANLPAELQRLRQAGCKLDINPQHGIRLIQAGLGCWADYLQSCSRQTRTIEVYQQTASTQDAARRLISHHPTSADKALIIADKQTAGRGRLGRRWHAPAGTCLTFSRIAKTTSPNDEQAINRLTFATSIAIAQTIDHWLSTRGLRSQIKWPNDIQVDGKKIAGILVEVVQSNGLGNLREHFAIIGVGLNINLLAKHLPDDPTDPALPSRITSLAIQNIHADRLAVLGRLMKEMDYALDAVPPDTLLDQWRQRSTLIGQHVRLQSDGREYTGEVADLDPNLGLILRTTNGSMVHLPAATTTVLL